MLYNERMIPRELEKRMRDWALFLGTGASMGIPVIGCDCSVCQSPSPFNKRMRSSLLLSLSQKRFLIDVGPDFRLQALKHAIHHLDGLLLTHSHFDHIAGLDDLRILCFRSKRPIPCALSEETLREVKTRYHYLMPEEREERPSSNQFDFHVFSGKEGSTTFEGVDLNYFSYSQKGIQVSGLRVKDFAYVIDILEYDPSIFKHLEGVRILVISGMTWKRTNAHIGIYEVIGFVEKVGCEQAYLTHMAHEVEHELANGKLPRGIQVAYDGLKLHLW